jgi:hypothetical protein
LRLFFAISIGSCPKLLLLLRIKLVTSEKNIKTDFKKGLLLLQKKLKEISKKQIRAIYHNLRILFFSFFLKSCNYCPINFITATTNYGSADQ